MASSGSAPRGRTARTAGGSRAASDNAEATSAAGASVFTLANRYAPRGSDWISDEQLQVLLAEPDELERMDPALVRKYVRGR